MAPGWPGLVWGRRQAREGGTSSFAAAECQVGDSSASHWALGVVGEEGMGVPGHRRSGRK